MAPQLRNSAPKSTPSLLSVVLGKGPLNISVSGREAHRHGVGCEGGWDKVKGGLQVGAHSPLVTLPLAGCLSRHHLYSCYTSE